MSTRFFKSFLVLFCGLLGCAQESVDSVPANTSTGQEAVASPQPPEISVSEATVPSETSMKVYTLENRPAGDWAGHWGIVETDESSMAWIRNDLNGFLRIASGEFLRKITFEPDGDTLKVIQEGKPLPYECRLSEDKLSLTVVQTETGEELILPKSSDPITGIVLENTDRRGALEMASLLTKLLMRDESEIPHFTERKAELRRIVDKYFDSFHEVEAGSYQTLTMNSDKSGFDAIRFKTPPADHNWDLLWEFVVDTSLQMHGWYILPKEGELEGFMDYEHAFNVSIEGVKLPPQNTEIKQSLTGGKLKPESEYMIWFGNADSFETPYELTFRLRFLPAE